MALTNRNLIANYTFNAAAKTIALTGIPSVNLARITLIENKTRGVVYYRPNDPNSTLTAAANVITLNATVNTTGHANTDALHIAYVEDRSYVEAVHKEWKVVTATGIPVAAVGNILIQAIRINDGVYVETWFNATTGAVFTTNPVVANLTENANKGHNLSGSQNGRQSWAMVYQQVTGLMTATLAGLAATQIVVDGLNVGVGSTYTVPAGKRLRIASVQLAGFGSAFAVPNTNSIYDDGYLSIHQAAAVTTASPVIAAVGWSYSISVPAGQQGLVAIQNLNRNWLDGEIDVAGGQQILIAGRSTNATSSSYRLNGSINGYLYNV